MRQKGENNFFFHKYFNVVDLLNEVNFITFFFYFRQTSKNWIFTPVRFLLQSRYSLWENKIISCMLIEIFATWKENHLIIGICSFTDKFIFYYSCWYCFNVMEMIELNEQENWFYSLVVIINIIIGCKVGFTIFYFIISKED